MTNSKPKQIGSALMCAAMTVMTVMMLMITACNGTSLSADVGGKKVLDTGGWGRSEQQL